MIDVIKLNPISDLAPKTLGANYQVSADCKNPTAALVRSFAMADWEVPSSLLCVARAGAGVNNIPFDDYATKGIIVFNTPGANANAVKELVLCAMFLANRNVIAGNAWANALVGDDVKKQVEKGKGQFAGHEILGKTIGILGLGAIGRKVAEAANALGMSVVGYDPFVSEAANAMSFVKIVNTKEEVYAEADVVTLHLPYNADTKNIVNADSIQKMKDGVIVINCARGELVDTAAIKTALDEKKVACYVTDFPDGDCLNYKGIIAIPHLGASTEEAEDNCAVMAAEEIRLFLEQGIIKNSVNMPSLNVAKTKAHRASVIYSGELNVNATAKVTNKAGITYAIIDSDEVIAPVANAIKFRNIF